ncbi:MAG: 2-hydroxyacyl-CoA dehydratase family protein [Spirochaetes bacterium]|nr:2-hydroxyacyl-CoA dehydratase family protein [Spirochaetota bacterium]
MAQINFKDRFVSRKYKLLNWLYIAMMAIKNGPYDMTRDLIKYPWLWELLKVNRLLTKLTEGRTGNYRKAIAMLIHEVTKEVIHLLEGIFHRSDMLVLHEDMVPPEILRAMGLSPWMPELLGILLPLLEPRAMEQYIDVAENEGIPPDVCSLPKAVVGMAQKNRIPPAVAVVTSNLPCDGGMTSYLYVQKNAKAPVFRLDIPHNFKDVRAEKYFAGELRRMIAWLEEHTPGKMDWDKLKVICEERNKMQEYELELWDLVSQKPAPLTAEAVYLGHLWFFNVCAGLKSGTRVFQKLVSLAKENVEKGIYALDDEKYRVLLWNPPTLHAIDLFVWAEKRYGVSCVMDSMTFNRLPFIDTSSEESMLIGIGRNIMNGPMARHTRGPIENYFDDMFYIVKRFNIDMIWMAGHIGCKNTQALNTIMREKCRQNNVPLLIIDYDLSDTRIVPREGIFAQVEHFMENVMHAKAKKIA